MRLVPLRTRLAASLATLAALLAIPAVANAAAISVNDTADPGSPGGTCTLREAIVSANNNNAAGNGCANGAAADAITFSVPTPATITLAGTQLPAIDAGGGAVTITGPGVIVSGNLASRVFETGIGSTTAMTGLTIANGFLAGSAGGDTGTVGGPGGNAGGAGIHNAGALALTGVTVRNNFVAAGSGGNGAPNAPVNNNGYAGGPGGTASGGGILNTGNLSIGASTLRENRAIGGPGGVGGPPGSNGNTSGPGGSGGDALGGAIANEGGTLIVDGSTLANNTAAGDGGGNGGNGGAGENGGAGGAGGSGLGGAISSSGQVTITGSTLSGNEVDGGFSSDGGNGGVGGTNGVPGAPGNGVGAGVQHLGVQSLAITNSTISGNQASTKQFDFGIGFGGGIATGDAAPLTATHVTLVDNAADFGANLGTVDGPVSLRATILASLAPSAQAANCYFGATVVTSLGFNLDDGTTCGLPGTDLEGVEPQLGPLANYGGPTQTHMPLGTSPVLNAVTAACPPPANDQRGMARVLNACDIGAVERQPSDPEPGGSGPVGGSPPPAQGSSPGAGPTGRRAAALKKCKKKKSKARKKCKKNALKQPV